MICTNPYRPIKKKIPNKIIKICYDCYTWGHDDAQKNQKIELKQFKAKLNTGYQKAKI